MQALGRDAQPLGDIPDRVSVLSDLFNCFYFELLGITFARHGHLHLASL